MDKVKERNKQKMKGLVISWIISCSLLLGAGIWLHTIGEELGANFLFAGLPITSIIYIVLARVAKMKREANND